MLRKLRLRQKNGFFIKKCVINVLNDFTNFLRTDIDYGADIDYGIDTFIYYRRILLLVCIKLFI